MGFLETLGLIESLCRLRFLFVGFARQFPDELRFVLAIGSPIRFEDVVEPDWRLSMNVWMLPRFPRQRGLRLSGDQAPVDRCNLVFLCNGKDRVKRAAGGASHVLRAEDRPLQPLQSGQMRFEILWPAVIVE